MSLFHNSAIVGSSGQGGYRINQSLRWRGSSSIYLSQSVNSAPTTSTSATLSFWMKAAQQNNGYLLFDCRNGSVDWGLSGGIKYAPGFGWGDATFGSAENATGVTNYWTLNQNSSQPALRDPSAWYHVVIIWDGNNGTSTSRMQVYVNGSQSYFYNYYGSIGSGASCPWTRNGYTLKVGGSSNSQFYMAELYCIDGQGLSPGNFAETDALTGAWVPKKYSGSYGNNGFYCKFDPAAANGIGHDHSGNGNNFTATGFSTSGTGTDVMSDTPTNNWCTLNPLNQDSAFTLSDGNLRLTSTANTSSVGVTSTSAVYSGKWYWEVTRDSWNINCGISLITTTSPRSSAVTGSGGQGVSYLGTNIYKDGSSVQSGLSNMTDGDVAGIALDLDSNTVQFYRNGSALGTAVSISAGTWTPSFGMDTGGYGANITTIFNFGQRGAFAYTPPTGFKALNTANLPEPTIKKGSRYMDVKLYTGNGTSQTIGGLGFSPDLVWIKNRSSSTYYHTLVDAVRGATKDLYSNTTDAEGTYSNSLNAFNSDGFTVGSGAWVNGSSNSMVAWAWDANGAGSTNTAGTITSTVSANATAGFSIVTYTGAGSNGTVGHGLGVAPKCVIVKNRSSSTAYNWYVWHSGLTSASYFMNLNRSDNSETFSNDPFGGTAPTSTVFTVGGENRVSSVNYVAYCFSEVSGYSRIGTYVGNSSSDGPYVNCGFKPAWVMVRARSSGSNWTIYDNKRQAAYNPTQTSLNAASTNVDGNLYDIDLLSNGFKLRTSDSQPNYNGWTYIFIAFAEHPFKYANAR